MQQRVRLKDVAAKAGVAVNTASTILNRRPNSWASRETTERVFRAARELGYRPSALARSLQSGRSMAVGLMVPDAADPFFVAFAAELGFRLDEAGYRLQQENARDEEHERERISGFGELAVEGVVLWPRRPEQALEELVRRPVAGPPTVLVRTDAASDATSYDTVVLDPAPGLRKALADLAAAGHRHLACLFPPDAVILPSAFVSRIERSWRKRVPGGQVSVLACGPGAEGACEAVKARLADAGEPRPTAILAPTDAGAVGAARAAREAGLSVPGTLSVIGCGDMPLAAFMTPSLSTFRVPVQDLAAAVARLLLERIGSPGEARLPQQVVVPVGFVARESHGPAA